MRALRYAGFDRDDGNREKCGGHGVSVVEIEGLFTAAPLVGPDPAHSGDETRFRAIGSTTTGRYVFVVFTWRMVNRRRLIRPISSRYMHAKEIKHYGFDA